MLRFHDSLTGPAERALLRHLSERTPAWVTSDGLTVLGLAGAAIACLGFWLANFDRNFLYLTVAGLTLNWLGDSLDGTIARHRKTERPQYGFFVDHSCDAFAMAMISIGIGLAPETHFILGLAVLIAYFLMVILSMSACLATGVFRVTFGGVGPTEIRLVIAACALAGIWLPVPGFYIGGERFSIYDCILLSVTAGLALAAIVYLITTARGLAKIDPPRG